MTVPAQSITKELTVNFISILGFDELGFWFHQGGGYSACSKFEKANVAHILCLSHYYSNCIKKNPAHIRRIKTRHSSAHFKHHWRNSTLVCMKHEESVCTYWWELWMLLALNTTFCLFSYVTVSFLISGTHFTMWVVWIPNHSVWHLILWYDCIE